MNRDEDEEAAVEDMQIIPMNTLIGFNAEMYGHSRRILHFKGR